MNTSNGCVYMVLDDRCQPCYDRVIEFINYLDIYSESKEILIDLIDTLIDLVICSR